MVGKSREMFKSQKESVDLQEKIVGDIAGGGGGGFGGGGPSGGGAGGGGGELAQQRLAELTQEIARSEAALKADRETMMEHIWKLEDQGKIRENSMQPVDGSAQIAAESRTIEGLELQRDQLIVTENLGPGHSQIQALDIAINDRKAKIAELESEGARVTGRGPKQVLQSSIDSMKQQVNDLQSIMGEASRPAEFLAGGELPFEIEGKPLSTGVGLARGSGSRASVESERRIIKELELQRDQLAAVGNDRLSHRNTALDLAISDRKAKLAELEANSGEQYEPCLLYTSPSPRDS